MSTKLSAFYLAVILIAGCVPSLHPLYTEKDVIFEEKLLGRWKEDDNIWTFKKGSDPNSYELNIRVDNEDGRFEAHLTKIKDSMYLDLYPDEPEIQANDYYKMHLLPVHTFLKVEAIDPNLQMRMMNPEFIAELVESNPDAVKHELVDDDNDRVVLTASTQQLRQFIAEYENEEKLFGDISNMERIVAAECEDEKPAEPNEKKIAEK